MDERMKNNFLKRLVSMGLAVSAGIYLTLPALASDSTAQNPASPSSTPSSPSKPTRSDSSATNSRGITDQYQTGQKLSQAVKDTNSLPGGWLCLNSPNPQCNQLSK